MIYGYMRISTDKQEQSRQEYMMKERNIPQENWFQDEISGTVQASKRPEFEKMLEILQSGDTIYFESLSRLGRSTTDLIDTVNTLTKKYKVKLVFLKESLTINPEGSGLDAVSNLFFTIMAAMAQFERDLIAQRTREGLRAKKEQGVILGRPKQDIPAKNIAAVLDLHDRGFNINKIVEKTGLGRKIVVRILNEN